MLSKEELGKWFLDKFNSCYRIESKIKGNYYLYYNKGYARQRKINSLLGKEYIKVPLKQECECLFILDYKNGYLLCDYDVIWSFLEEQYSSSYGEIASLIESFLVLTGLTPKMHYTRLLSTLEDECEIKLKRY